MNIALPHLPRDLPTSAQLRQLIEQDETLSLATFRDDDISGMVSKSFNAYELRLQKISVSQAKLEKTSFSDIEFLNCDLIAASFAEASWRRVLIKGTRASGLQLQSSTLKDVSFIDCKLNLANFRFSKLTNVRFLNCILDETDFSSAELHNVIFQLSTLNKTQFSGARLRQVDLRTSDILSISGISSLAGAIVDSTQLISLAPALAAELKIQVKDVE